MDEKTTNIFTLIIKDNSIFHLNTWVRVLIWVLYIDFFLGYGKNNFDLEITQIADMFNGKIILIFVLFTIFTLCSLTLLAICIYYCMDFFIVTYFPPRCSYNSISEKELKEFAILTNNKVAEKLSRQLEKVKNEMFYNLMLKIAVIIILICDYFYGKYIAIIRDNGIFYAVLILFIGIVIFQIVMYDQRKERGIDISNFCKSKINEAVGDRKSIIDD